MPLIDGNLYWQNRGGTIDAKDLFIQVGGATVSLDETINNMV
ncbi:hypothetical protein ACI2VH_23650 [Ralstonia nicotianae]|nr:hypothetical protein [Ralstonia nicotianae]